MVVVSLLRGLLALAYPLLIYVGLERWGARMTAMLLLGVASTSILLNLVQPKPKRTRFAAWPLIAVAFLGASIVSNNQAFLLALPALINLGFLITFALTLRTQIPMAERFARFYVKDLRPEERAYCRNVTRVWCGFFTFNAAIAAATALWAPLSWWSLYNGLVAYVLTGLVFAIEYLVRKHKFRRFGSAFHDRLLRRLLPLPANRR